MTIDEALNLVDDVCANAPMVRKNHVAVQQAMVIIRNECSKIPKAEEKDKK